MHTQPASPERAPESVLSKQIIPSLPVSSVHTDLGGGKDTVLVAVYVDSSHWIQIQQMWTECLLRVRPCEKYFMRAFSPYP